MKEAENIVRVAMHPTDQFAAFQAMADQGRSVDEIASRYGVAGRTVEQRLKLARVSPALIAAFKEDEIGREAMMDFTITDDHGCQERVWRTCGGRSYATDVRRRLTEGKISRIGGAPKPSLTCHCGRL